MADVDFSLDMTGLVHENLPLPQLCSVLISILARCQGRAILEPDLYRYNDNDRTNFTQPLLLPA